MNRLISCVLMTLLAQTSLAQQPAWYQVEMLIFAYTNPDQLAEEQWPVPEQAPEVKLKQTLPGYGSDGLGYYYKAAHLMSSSISSTRLPVAPPLAWLSPTGPIRQNSLAWHAKKLNQQRDIQVLWHETWVEAVQPKSGAAIHPVNLMLSGNPEIHVTGGFSLHVSRYLHITTDLTVQHIGDIPIETEVEQPLLPPVGSSSVGSNTTTATNSKTPGTGLNLTPVAPQRFERGTLRYGQVIQSRKMRSKELHYIDHPLMGIVIKLLPIKVPEPEGVQ